jgi:hypothetical protein
MGVSRAPRERRSARDEKRALEESTYLRPSVLCAHFFWDIRDFRCFSDGVRVRQALSSQDRVSPTEC